VWGPKVDAGVDTEKERLSSESYGSAIRSVRVQSAGVVADGLRGEECHLKIDNLLAALQALVSCRHPARG